MSLLLSIVLSAQVAHAAPLDPFEEPDESELFRLDEELVTVASKYAQTIRKAPSIVTVITSDDIRARGYRKVSDALRMVPGIYVWKTPEGRDLVTIRGVVSGDNNKVLLLVDGMPWYDGVYTHASLDDYLPISHIKQIEVIKGPGSAIYGTNAFAGVVNVVTHDADDINGARIRAMVGGYGRTDVTAMVGGSDHVGGLHVKGKAYARVLENVGDGADITPDGGRNVLGTDPSRGMNIGAQVDVNGLRLQIHHVDYRHTYFTNTASNPVSVENRDLDEYYLSYHDTFFRAQWAFDVSRDARITPYLQSQRHDDPGQYWFSRGYDASIDGGEDPGPEDDTLSVEERTTLVETEKDTRRWGVGVDFEARPALDHVTVAGLGMEQVVIHALVDREFVDGDGTGVSTGFEGPAGASLTNLFGFVQHTWTALPQLELTAGVRLDKRLPPGGDIENAATANVPLTPSPRVGVLLVPNESTTIKLLYGRAFRAPNVREFLVKAPYEDEANGVYAFASGSLDVGPEIIDSVEAELQIVPVDDFEARISAYYSTLGGEIDKAAPTFEYRNLEGRLNVVGGEAGFIWSVDPATIDVAYSLTFANYTSDAFYANRPQYEFPQHMFKGGVDVAVTPNLGVWLGGELYTPRPRLDWNDVGVVDGDLFGLAHLGIEARNLGKQNRVSMTGSIFNVVNSDWGTGVYRDSVDTPSRSDPSAARYPLEIEGERRGVYVGLEASL